MKEKYSVKKGRIEAVSWILLKNNKIIIEKRPKYEPGESICIPCGHINSKDKNIESAFLRESKEEFGNFKPVKYKFLKIITFEEKNKKGKIERLRLHYFVVTEWNGKIPKFTKENGKKHAKLIWFSISKYKRLPQSCDRKAIKELLKRR